MNFILRRKKQETAIKSYEFDLLNIEHFLSNWIFFLHFYVFYFLKRFSGLRIENAVTNKNKIKIKEIINLNNHFLNRRWFVFVHSQFKYLLVFNICQNYQEVVTQHCRKSALIYLIIFKRHSTNHRFFFI